MNKTKQGLFFILLSLLLMGYSCGKTSKISIEGELTGHHPRMIYLYEISPDGAILRDSSKIVKHGFKFKINSQEPKFYRISLSGDNAFTTLARNGDRLLIKADASNLVKTYTISGGKDAGLMWELDHNLKVFIDSMDYLQTFYDRNIENDSIRMQIEERYNTLVEKHTSFLKRFIMQNSHSMASVTAFYQFYNRKHFFDEQSDLELLKQIYSNLNAVYPTNEYVAYLKKRIETIELRKSF